MKLYNHKKLVKITQTLIQMEIGDLMRLTKYKESVMEDQILNRRMNLT